MKKILTLTIIGLWALMAAAQDHQPALADLIEQGKREQALELLRVGADVNARQGDGASPLHWAVYRADAELVEALLAREAVPDFVNNFGSTPLAEAVKIANAEIVAMLLRAGADPDAMNEDQQTALMLAARDGLLPIGKLLIEHGAEVNVAEQWRGQTALMWAAANNHGPFAELLIEHGAEVHRRADFFDWETQITSEPRAQYRPTGGLTPLLYAARGGCLRCARAMLAAGADINLPDPNGVSPLMVAIDNLHFDLAAYLLEQGAYPHSWDWWGRTPLYIAIDVNNLTGRFAREGNGGNELSALEVARLLLEAGVNADSQLNMHRPGRGAFNGRFTDDLLNSGATPLLRAAIDHDVEGIRLLLEYGAAVDLPNAMGVTPLIAAAGIGTPTRLLRGQYSAAAQDRSLAILAMLLAAGADINARIKDTSSHTARIARISSMTNRQGQNALFGAARQGWVEVARYLVANGADVSVADDSGKTLLDAAKGDAGGRTDRPFEQTEELLKIFGGEG